MHAEDRTESLAPHSGPHSGVILRNPKHLIVPTDAYDTDDEVTMRAIPLPVIIARSRLVLLCIACAVAGSFVTLAIGWIR